MSFGKFYNIIFLILFVSPPTLLLLMRNIDNVNFNAVADTPIFIR